MIFSLFTRTVSSAGLLYAIVFCLRVIDRARKEEKSKTRNITARSRLTGDAVVRPPLLPAGQREGCN